MFYLTRIDYEYIYSYTGFVINEYIHSYTGLVINGCF